MLIKGIEKNIILKNDVEVNFFIINGYGYERANNRTYINCKCYVSENSFDQNKSAINEGNFDVNFYIEDTYAILQDILSGTHPEQAYWNKILTKNNIQLRDGTIVDFTQNFIQKFYTEV